MEDIRLIRKRYIPKEEVILSGDKILFNDEKNGIIVTKWNPIKPRSDVGSGVSEYHLRENYKVSAFFNKVGDFLYYYVDIINYFERDGYLVVVDLLVDVKKDKSGKVSVLDMEELEDALKSNLVSREEYEIAIKTKDYVVQLLRENNYVPKYIDMYV